ncbi:MAG: LAGLIDADG family homing endonuclease [Candidatus Colwellbacteria bacterium]|nr:LAGLIDADG family homing endonuclease [Candidatus Colwellbacteria bacterium]
MLHRKLSCEYIRGLVEGEGSFTFSAWRRTEKRVPSFQIKMHARNIDLLRGIRDELGLKNKVYVYHYPGHDGAKRGPQAMLIVREIGSLKNTIIPLFYNKLAGNRAFEFENWLERIGGDPWVPESYKILYRLHKNGYYRKNTPRFRQ